MLKPRKLQVHLKPEKGRLDYNERWIRFSFELIVKVPAPLLICDNPQCKTKQKCFSPPSGNNVLVVDEEERPLIEKTRETWCCNCGLCYGKAYVHAQCKTRQGRFCVDCGAFVPQFQL